MIDVADDEEELEDEETDEAGGEPPVLFLWLFFLSFFFLPFFCFLLLSSSSSPSLRHHRHQITGRRFWRRGFIQFTSFSLPSSSSSATPDASRRNSVEQDLTRVFEQRPRPGGGAGLVGAFGLTPGMGSFHCTVYTSNFQIISKRLDIT